MPRRLAEIALIALSAGLLVLPYHFSELWPLTFFAFIPYFFAISGKSPSEAFKSSYFFGVIFFAALGFWLTLVNPYGTLLLVAYLSLYFGIFGYLSCHFISSKDLKGVLYAAVIWTALEYVRGWLIGGLPWALLSYSQWRNLVFIQIADVIGAFGVSFVLLGLNLLLFRVLVLRKDPKRSAFFVLLIAVALIGVTVYGAWRMDSVDSSASNQRRIRISVVQGNIPQDQKWNTKIKSIIFEKYKRLTFMAALEKADLVVWPETSFPGYLEDEPVLVSRLRNMVRQSKADLLVGAPTIGNLNEGLKFYNSAILYDSSGEEKKRTHKIHLVPFGEYIPLEPLLGVLRKWVAIGHFTAGEERTIFVTEFLDRDRPVKARFAVLICFEDIFPWLVHDLSGQGVDFLVNITNDAWFGKTAAPYQHAAASVFRAVENRVPVVRAANTGYSCFVSSTGQILDSVSDRGQEIFVTGQKTYELTLKKIGSFYANFGDVFFFVILALCYLAYRERKRQSGYAQL